MEIERKMSIGEWTTPVTVYKYAHMDKWQSVSFGFMGDTPEEVFEKVQKWIDAHKNDAADNEDVSYQAGYAYACGYQD